MNYREMANNLTFELLQQEKIVEREKAELERKRGELRLLTKLIEHEEQEARKLDKKTGEKKGAKK